MGWGGGGQTPWDPLGYAKIKKNYNVTIYKKNELTVVTMNTELTFIY